jgi:hypothetical protein
VDAGCIEQYGAIRSVRSAEDDLELLLGLLPETAGSLESSGERGWVSAS